VYSKDYRGPRRRSLERTKWLHIVEGKERKVIGYMEECTHPRRRDRKVNIVYDKFLKKVGFVTPHGVVYKYKEDGSSKRMGLVPAKGVQGFLLDIHRPVNFVNPVRKEDDKGVLVVPEKKKGEEAPAPEPKE
jgi:hypothetical protein